MKVAWVSPLAERSAIGRFTAGVTAELSRKGVEVDIFRSESSSSISDPAHTTRLRVFRLRDAADALGKYDVVIYNLGDYDGYHHYSVNAAKRVRGICIFHDVYYNNLFRGWMIAGGLPDELAAVGEAISADELRLRQRAGQSEANGPSYGTLEHLAQFALGAVVHSGHYLQRVSKACAGPVQVIPLAYNSPGEIPHPFPRQGSKLKLVTIGRMNENKCIEEVVRVLGESTGLKERCTYRLVGHVTEKKRTAIEKLAKELDVSVALTGEVGQETLAAEIADADAIVCLRNPPLEGASASVIEALLSRRPVIVTNHGFYADLPDALVLKIEPNNQRRGLEHRLLGLLDNPDANRLMAVRAHDWASTHFSFSQYADALTDLIHRVIEGEPLVRLGIQLGHELAAAGVPANHSATSRVADAMNQLFMRDVHQNGAMSEGHPYVHIITAIRSAMTGAPLAPLEPVVIRRRKRRGVRRVLRAIALPIEHLTKVLSLRLRFVFQKRELPKRSEHRPGR